MILTKEINKVNMKKFLRNILIIFFLLFSLAVISAGIFAYPKAFAVNVGLEKESGVEMDEPAVVLFSESVITDTVEKSLRIYPSVPVSYIWKNSGKELSIMPEAYWLPETEYEIKINGGRSVMLTSAESNLTFKTINLPRVESFSPEKGAEDVVIDIEEPFVVKFNKPIKNFKVKIKINPSQKLTYNLNKEKTELKILSYSGFEEGQRYDIHLYAKSKNEDDSAYKEIGSTFFQTKPPAPENWAEDFGTRLIQARKFTEAKIKTGKYIDINLQNQIMTIFEDGKLLDAFLISSGKRGMDTPKGTHKIYNKTLRTWSSKYGLYMPYWMSITPSGSHGIHELPEWPGGYKEGQDHLGTPVSHGCVRLGVGAAGKVYMWADIGTSVIAY